MLDAAIEKRLTAWGKHANRITVMTGAGVSAESGIPTFRGPEGYWTIGSTEYFPEQMATQAMFQQSPEEVWRWYLYRRTVCQNADPNTGHFALEELERALQNRFTLITQNVDGLHLRAGNSAARTFEIHGNINAMRCAANCTSAVYPIPQTVPPKGKDDPFTDDDRQSLRCPKCGEMARPHILWFDESYNEEHFRFESSLMVAAETDLLIVVGTSGATNLPNQVAYWVARGGGIIIDVNVQRNRFTEMALQNGGGFVQQPSAQALPSIAAAILSGV